MGSQTCCSRLLGMPTLEPNSGIPKGGNKLSVAVHVIPIKPYPIPEKASHTIISPDTMPRKRTNAQMGLAAYQMTNLKLCSAGNKRA
jgi:hypothetical protein